MDALQDFQPLAERMRPRCIEDMVGLGAFASEGGVLAQAIARDKLYSIILWGPPGCGKTTLAKIVAKQSRAAFVQLNAVMAGVADLRAAVEAAKLRQNLKQRTVLFIDEIHRFNKAQQDALLHPVETGIVTLIGATTENPSFALNNALLSRCRVHVLKALDTEALEALLDRTAQQALGCELETSAKQTLAAAADGDARRALNGLEIAFELSSARKSALISLLDAEQAIGHKLRQFDKGDDWHHELISALHKTLRNSNPDAALYWFVRMLDGGVDPNYIARRLLRMAVEDIGLADPRAPEIALSAWQTFERLGAPEGELALAQAVVYLAMAPKSNAIYTAYKQARRLVAERGSDPVPMHLRNASTQFNKSLGAGNGYQYDHDFPYAVAFAQRGFPDALSSDPPQFYEPTDRGLELKLRERWQWLRTERARQA